MSEKPEMTGAEVAAKIAALEATVRNSAAELAALKAKLEPPKAKEPSKPKVWHKYDPTEGMSMPPSAMKAMVDLIPDRKSQPGFNAHAWAQTKGPGSPGGFGGPQPVGGPGKPVERGSGWAEPVKENPRNFDIFDQMVASQVGGPNDTRKLK